jgi:hypothetical protein
MKNINTPAQAAILIRAFMDNLREASIFGYHWEPSQEVKDGIKELDVEEKSFPVSDLQFYRNDLGDWVEEFENDWATFIKEGDFK